MRFERADTPCSFVGFFHSCSTSASALPFGSSGFLHAFHPVSSFGSLHNNGSAGVEDTPYHMYIGSCVHAAVKSRNHLQATSQDVAIPRPTWKD